MNSSYPVKLETGSKKRTCPGCGKKTFHGYIDTRTGELLPLEYGRCDREIKCGYFVKPPLNGSKPAPGYKPTTKPVVETISAPVFFPWKVYSPLTAPDRFKENKFLDYLITRAPFSFPEIEVYQVAKLYQVGTIIQGYWQGAAAFPFIDPAGNIRAVQVKQFNDQNHTTRTTFLHAITERFYRDNSKPLPEWLKRYISQENKVSCLFGAHLLSRFKDNPVCLVEAPKTAIYATLYFGSPEHSPDTPLWLAVGSLSYFTPDRLQVLKGRQVRIYPDAAENDRAFQVWQAKSREIFSRLPGTTFEVSAVLNQYSTPEDKAAGIDLADVLIRMDWREFRRPTEVSSKTLIHEPIPEPETLPPGTIDPGPVETQPREQMIQPRTTDPDYEQLKDYFSGVNLESFTPLKLSDYETITDLAKCVKFALDCVKSSAGSVRRANIELLQRIRRAIGP